MEYIDSFTFRKKQTNQQQPNENGRNKNIHTKKSKHDQNG